MTHSGGKPHEVGDRGQRYEITFLDGDARRVLGWSETVDGARQMADGVHVHPSWQYPEIRDRKLPNALRDMMAAYERLVRSHCATPAELVAEPWRCLEYRAAEEVLTGPT